MELYSLNIRFFFPGTLKLFDGTADLFDLLIPSFFPTSGEVAMLPIYRLLGVANVVPVGMIVSMRTSLGDCAVFESHPAHITWCSEWLAPSLQ